MIPLNLSSFILVIFYYDSITLASINKLCVDVTLAAVTGRALTV